jgi:methyltransferase (TIGR00027 family)
VLLAAGLDTRAFRLEWPDGVTVYEVDAPLVLSFKEKVLAGGGARARSGRHVVAADLREDWPTALCGAGFDPAQPAAWLAEGLLMYLSGEAKTGLLAAVQALSAPDSQVAIEHIPSLKADVESNATFREAAERTDFDVGVDVLWPDEQDHDPVARLRTSGWSVNVSPITEIAKQYGRALSPALPEGMRTALLATARRS